MSKPKRNQKSDPNVSDPRDRCETPAYALDPLLPFLWRFKHVWESACGTGKIIRVLAAKGFTVTGSDMLLAGPQENFFLMDPPAGTDVIITNPPYSVKVDWIAKCYAVGLPFALLVPVETIGLGRVQRMMEQYGAELILLDKRVNFHMPYAGLSGSGAQFPVLWFCHRLLPAPVVYGKIVRRPDEQLQLFDEVES